MALSEQNGMVDRDLIARLRDALQREADKHLPDGMSAREAYLVAIRVLGLTDYEVNPRRAEPARTCATCRFYTAKDFHCAQGVTLPFLPAAITGALAFGRAVGPPSDFGCTLHEPAADQETAT